MRLEAVRLAADLQRGRWGGGGGVGWVRREEGAEGRGGKDKAGGRGGKRFIHCACVARRL